MKRVVLSSDTNPDYSFYAPLTCAVWEARGYRPLLLLVGSAHEWEASPHASCALACARPIADVHFVPKIDGYKTSTIAQVSRLFGAAYTCSADDYLITSDIDMWPIGAWVGGAADRSKLFDIYYANAYAKQRGVSRFPMCYLGANADVWRSVMDFSTGDIGPLLEKALAECAGMSVGEWDFDEIYFARKLASWRGYPLDCQMIPRTFGHGEDRIDRSAWQLPSSIDGFADAHLLRPGYGANWGRIRPLLAMVLDEKKMKYVDIYRENYEASS